MEINPCTNCKPHLEGKSKDEPPCSECKLPALYAASMHDPLWRGDDVFSKVTVVRFKNTPVPITDGSLWPH